MLSVTAMSGFGATVEDKGPVAISFTANSSNLADVTNGTYTFSSQAIGAVAADRYIVLTIARQSTAVVTGITVAGTACSIVARTANSDDHSAIWITDSAITSGTTATIVVTVTSTSWQMLLGVFRMVGANPSASATDTDITNSAPMTCTATVPANGGYVCSARHQGSAGYTWTDDDGATSPIEAFDVGIEYAQSYTSAYNNTTTEQASLAVTCAPGSSSTEQGMCMATWGPG